MIARAPEKVAERLNEIVAFARANSPYYRDLYRDLPARVEDSRLLPVTDKKQLVARFDDWVTDREVTLEKVRAFIAKPELVGENFLGKYLVGTTSGTTGTPGIFLVMLLKSPIPDLVIGIGVAAIVIKGGWDILREAREARDPADRAPQGDRG